MPRPDKRGLECIRVGFTVGRVLVSKSSRRFHYPTAERLTWRNSRSGGLRVTLIGQWLCPRLAAWVIHVAQVEPRGVLARAIGAEAVYGWFSNR